jgi:hypothetical protein
MNEYKEGQNEEISQFPQARVIYEPAKEIHTTYPTKLYETLKLSRIRAELKALRRGRSG